MSVEVVESTAEAELAVGSVLGGKYRVTGSVLAHGAEVRCSALHEGTGRSVELRVLAQPDDAQRERMMRAARAAGSAPHAHVLGVLDSGSDARGRLFVVYEHVDGEGAGEFVAKHGPLPLLDAAELVHQLARALVSLHQRGIVHRAIRPEHVRITRVAGLTSRGEPRSTSSLRAKLTGFELAVVPPRFAAAPALPRGFSRFAAPETRRDPHEASAAADLFALGVLLRLLATGSDAASAALTGHAERIVTRATADDPEARFAHAEQLVAALSLLLPSDQRAGSVLPTDPLLADVRYLHKLGEQTDRDARDDSVEGVSRAAALVMIEAVYGRIGRDGWRALVQAQPALDALLPRAGAVLASEPRVSSALIERFLLHADAALRDGQGAELSELPSLGTNIAQRGLRRIFPAYPAQLTVQAWIDSLPALYGALYTDGAALVLDRTEHTARLVVRGQKRPSLALFALFAGLVRAELVRLAPFGGVRLVASAERGEQQDELELSFP